MLLKSDILAAQSKSKSAAEAARYLNVDYKTYRKWALYHGVFENLINQAGKGLAKLTQKSTIDDVIIGKKKHWNLKTYVYQLIKYGYKKDCCELCEYDRKRPDGRAPYLLHFLDGDRENHKLDNIQLICYNCYYVEVGRELIGIKKRKYWTPDYFRKYNDEDYNKYNEFEYNDFDLEKVAKEDYFENKKKDDEVDEIFKKLNK
jgi:hypothetical protein